MIDLHQILDSAVYAFQVRPFVSAGALVVTGILLAWKPKAVLKTVATGLAIVLAIYIMSLIFDALNIGFTGKEKLFHQEPD